jgi:hypothetical protein
LCLLPFYFMVWSSCWFCVGPCEHRQRRIVVNNAGRRRLVAIFSLSARACCGAIASLCGNEDFLSEWFILYSMQRLNCDDTVDLSNPAPARRR